MAACAVAPLRASLACQLLRAAAALLHRLADRLDRAGCLPLEPVKIVLEADERIQERRHQLFVRYY